MKVPDEAKYTGPHIPTDFTFDDVMSLLQYFAEQRFQPLEEAPRLHVRYVFIILTRFLKVAKNFNGVMHVNRTSKNAHVTVVGDMHGQLRDLCEIMAFNGPPSPTNKYVFNGDLVDRGENSFEVALIVMAMCACDPQVVMINRGNHEDIGICQNYGFVAEIVEKYGPNASSGGKGEGKAKKGKSKHAGVLCSLFAEIFALLPLATVSACSNVCDSHCVYSSLGRHHMMKQIPVHWRECSVLSSASARTPSHAAR